MTDRNFTLPDPEVQPEFYRDVPSKRLMAWIVDMIVVGILCLLILPFTAFTALFFFPFLMLVVGFIYRVLTITGGSATWGMRLMGIELRTQNGQGFDFSAALLHSIGYSISMALPLLQVISVILMLTTARGQGLTDNIMGSVAINRRART